VILSFVGHDEGEQSMHLYLLAFYSYENTDKSIRTFSKIKKKIMNQEDLFEDKLIDLEARSTELVPQESKFVRLFRAAKHLVKTRWGSILVFVFIAVIAVILVILFYETYF
jgi:hypothetical protein